MRPLRPIKGLGKISPRLLIVRSALPGKAVDFVVREVVVLVFDERNFVVVGLGQILVLGEVDANVVCRGVRR